MSGQISFTNISPTARVPLFYVQMDSSQAGVAQTTQRALLIGQTLSSGTASAGVPVFVPDLFTAIAMFGKGSMAARMYHAYISNDPVGEVWVLPLADNSAGTAGTGDIVFSATATQAGTFPLYLAGQSVPFAVSVGDTATVQGTNCAAAINAMAGLPLTATASAGTVVLTAKHKGVAAGALDIRVAYAGIRSGEVVPGGVAYAITAFSGGASDPDLGSVGTAMGAVLFDAIVHPYTGSTDMGEMKQVMSDASGRWSPSVQQFGHVFTFDCDTSANLLTLGGANNDQHTTIAGTYNSPTPACEWAAAWCGAVFPSLKADPARPLQTLPIYGVLAPPEVSQFTPSVQQSLLSTGIALPMFDDSGQAYVCRCVTTYQTNAYGQADQSYLDAETLYTLMSITRQLKAMVTTKYGRCKLADDGTPFGPGQPVVTPSIIKADMVALYNTMQRAGLCENAAAMQAATIVIRNSNDPSRVDVLWAPYLISGLRIFAVLNQFRLSAA
jgi:phage tail sheath gpL-like